jgi:hypothetical protein
MFFESFFESFFEKKFESFFEKTVCSGASIIFEGTHLSLSSILVSISVFLSFSPNIGAHSYKETNCVKVSLFSIGDNIFDGTGNGVVVISNSPNWFDGLFGFFNNGNLSSLLSTNSRCGKKFKSNSDVESSTSREIRDSCNKSGPEMMGKAGSFTEGPLISTEKNKK